MLKSKCGCGNTIGIQRLSICQYCIACLTMLHCQYDILIHFDHEKLDLEVKK